MFLLLIQVVLITSLLLDAVNDGSDSRMEGEEENT